MAPELLKLTQFFHVDFESPESEQLIGIVRGAREDFPTSFAFGAERLLLGKHSAVSRGRGRIHMSIGVMHADQSR